MQPTRKLRKTLLAGALILGVGSTFNASADLFPVVAGAIPDVTAGMVAGYTELSFGTGVIGNKVGESCIMAGITGMADAELLWDANADNASTAASNFGALSGNACIGTAGVPMVIEIDGSDAATVTVTVADVVGAGYTYTPTAESCVVDYDRTAGDGSDSCVSLAGNTVTGVGMSLTQTDGAGNSTETTTASYGYAATSGKTRMVLAGQITIDSEMAPGTVIADNIIVQVTYE